MTESVENAETFARILKEKCNKKPLILYKNNETKRPKLAPQDVLKHVSSQLKAIQQADSVGPTKYLKTSGFKQSCFLSVNRLPVSKEVQKHNTKFETQCVTDTQLIDLVQNVEENVINTEIVHDFNTSFDYKHSDEKTHIDKVLDDVEVKCEPESYSNINEYIATKRVVENINNAPIHSEIKHSDIKETHDLNTLELCKISKQNSDCESKKIYLGNLSPRQIDTDSFQAKKYLNIQTNKLKQPNKNSDETHSKDNCMKKVVFMSLELNINENIKEVSNTVNNTAEAHAPLQLHHSDQRDCNEEVNIPLSIILNNKKEKRKIIMKDDNENYCTIHENDLRENKENEELSISKEMFTEDYDYNKQVIHNNPSNMRENVLRENNCSAFTTKTMCDNFINNVNRYIKEDLPITTELFTEDDKVDYDIENRKYTAPCILKDTVREVDYQEKDDIILEPNQTLCNDVDIDFEFETPESNIGKQKTTIFSTSIANIERMDNDELNEKYCHQMNSLTNKLTMAHLKSQINESNLDSSNLVGNMRSTSPIFNIKSEIRKSNTPSPLVFDLECFEKFENIAFSLIDTTDDIKAAKHLIDSQILSNELYLYGNKHVSDNMRNEKSNIDGIIVNSQNNVSKINNDLCGIEPHCSPIFNCKNGNNRKHNHIINAKKTDEKMECNTDEVHSKIVPSCTSGAETNVKISSIVEDEILFSSDEESEYVQKDIQELPYTCILDVSDPDMSYCDTSEVLDKTMYVGFQTASNKSIQISTDSYKKAKSILDINVNNKRLSDLVVLIDQKSKIDVDNIHRPPPTYVESQNNKKSAVDIDCNAKTNTEIVLTSNKNNNNMSEVKLKQDINLSHDNFSTLDKIRKRPLEGFMTASNKRIKLSNAALARCKKVFVDIDVDDDFIFNDNEILNLKDDNPETPNKNEDINAYDVFDLDPHNYLKYGQKCKSQDRNIKGGKSRCTTNLENMTQVNFNDELIIQEFENIEMSVEEKSNKKNANSTSDDVDSSSAKIIINNAGETEDLLQDLNLTEIVHKCLKNNYLNMNNDVVFKTNENPDTEGYDPDTKSQTAAKENMLEMAEKNNFEAMSNISKNNRFGFRTTINKNIGTRDSALANYLPDFQSKLDFKTCNDNGQDNMKTTNTMEFKNLVDNVHTNKSFEGFQTSSDKPTIISESSLQKTKNISRNLDINETKINNETEEFENKTGLSEVNNFRLSKYEDIFEVSKKSNEKIKSNKSEEVQIFDGFQTASNKLINISKEAFKLTKEIFKDINLIGNDIDESDLCNNDNRLKLTGFQTASNKPVRVTKQAINRTMGIFKDIDLKNTDDGCNDDIDKCTGFIAPKIAYKAPNNSKLLEQDKNTLKDIECMNLANRVDQNNPSDDYISKTTIGFTGFQTANDKSITISKHSQQNPKDIFQDVGFVSTSTQDSKDSRRNITKFVGFQTASKKPVTINEQALINAKDLFRDIDFKTVIEDENQKKENSSNNRVTSTFSIFQTANSKPVSISEDALQKSKQFFKDVTPWGTLCNKNEVHNAGTRVTSTAFKGFQTANNKPINISEKFLRSAKDLFKDIDIFVVDTIENELSHTENNKAIQVSNEALLKSKSVFQDIDFKKQLSVKYNTNIGNINLEGFKTASNKKVNISKQVLERCKNIFNDIDLSESLDKDNQNTVQGNNNEKIHNLNTFPDSDITTGNNFTDADNMVRTHYNKTTQYRNIKKSVNTVLDRNCKSHTRIQSTLRSDSRNENSVLDKEKHNNSVKIRTVEQTIGFPNDVNDGVNGKNNVHSILNTQIENNFEITLHTEDFNKTPPKVSRRSGSPILSCHKAKKRKKFEVPYSAAPMKKNFNSPVNYNVKNQEIYKFAANYKTTKRYYLKDLINIEAQFTSNNNESNNTNYLNNLEDIDLKTFVFEKDRNDLNKEIVTMEKLKIIFENSVDKMIIPEKWFENHLKFILWKLLEYENRFPNCMKNVCNVTNVLDQLKHRYDIELYDAKRPALRRILEKDDVSSKFMILRVAGIYMDGVLCKSVINPTSNIELLLTDGWYTIKATIDKMLATLVSSKKIVVGTKLATSGAELLNCDQGVSPWEDTSSVRLKLHGNSTRRAHWDARLGYHRNAAILSSLGAVKMDGGKVAKLRVFITRVYPALYVEKFEDGSTVTRSERLEHLHQMRFESERAAALEKIYEEVEKQISDQESQDSDVNLDSDKRACMETGSQIAKIMKKCMDPVEFHNHLTSTQHKLLEDHTIRRRERLLEEIQKRVREKIDSRGVCVNRNVVQLLKIRVIGVEKNGVGIAKGVLSIWKPNDAILELFEEGACIEVMNVIPTAMRQTEIQLSAGRQSIFRKHTPKNDSYKPFFDTYKRQSFKISELLSQPCTQYNEIDTVGVIIDIEPNSKEFDIKKHNFQIVYLSDERQSVASLIFWGGIKKFGYEGIFELGQVVCCINLQKRLGNSRKSIPSFRVTEFSYFTKTPKYKHLRFLLDFLCNNMVSVDMSKFRAECLVVKNNLFSKVSNNVNTTSFRCNYHDTRSNKSAFKEKLPLVKNKSDDLNLSGLEFDSTFKHSEQQISPKLLKRKHEIKEKISKLKLYGEPPPLNPIYIINKSKNASSSFKSPFANRNDVSNNSDVSSVNGESIIGKESTKCNTGLSRAYGKMEPSRIDFSIKDDSNMSAAVDPFAEEFDCSPPLSLD